MVKVISSQVRRGMVSVDVDAHQVIAADGMRVEISTYVMPVDGEIADISAWGREIKADGRKSRFVNAEGIEIPQNVVHDLFGALV